MIRLETNGNLQDFRFTDRIESLKSKIESSRRVIKSNVLCCRHIESQKAAILKNLLAKISKVQIGRLTSDLTQ